MSTVRAQDKTENVISRNVHVIMLRIKRNAQNSPATASALVINENAC